MAITKPSDASVSCVQSYYAIAIAKFGDVAFTALASVITAAAVAAGDVAKWVIQNPNKDATLNFVKAAGDYYDENGVIPIPNLDAATLSFIRNLSGCGWVVFYYISPTEAFVQGVDVDPGTPTVVNQSQVPCEIGVDGSLGAVGTRFSGRVNCLPQSQSKSGPVKCTVAFAALGT